MMSNNLTYNLTYVGRQVYLNKSIYTGGLVVLNRFFRVAYETICQIYLTCVKPDVKYI